MTCAHLANVIFNWAEMKYPVVRLIVFLVWASGDTGLAIYSRYHNPDDNVGYVAHFAGAVVGLLLGIVTLRNLRVLKWETVVWWCSFVVLLGLFIAMLVANFLMIAELG